MHKIIFVLLITVLLIMTLGCSVQPEITDNTKIDVWYISSDGKWCHVDIYEDGSTYILHCTRLGDA